LYKSC
ncbi:hypothetical protein ADUPG1_008042, partial [Aduncisulcus paluster]